MRVDESSCDSMKLDRSRRWFMMVDESSGESMRVHVTR